MRELRLPQLARLAVGDAEILKVRAGPEGMRLTALRPGATHLLAWTRNGERQVYRVSVTAAH